MKINKNLFSQVCLCLWVLYFIYGLILSIYEFPTLKKIDWQGARSHISSYFGGKAVITTYKFTKDSIDVTRVYGIRGVNIWFLSGIDRDRDTLNISFYVTNSNYDKIVNHKAEYYKTIFGEYFQKRIPFFGLRKYGESANKIMLFLDVWKHNYDDFPFALVFVVLVHEGIKYILRKFTKIEFIERGESKVSKIIGRIMPIMIGVTFFYLII